MVRGTSASAFQVGLVARRGSPCFSLFALPFAGLFFLLKRGNGGGVAKQGAWEEQQQHEPSAPGTWGLPLREPLPVAAGQATSELTAHGARSVWRL